MVNGYGKNKDYSGLSWDYRSKNTLCFKLENFIFEKKVYVT